MNGVKKKYSAYDQDISRSILSHYDEDKEEDVPFFTLNDEGQSQSHDSLIDSSNPFTKESQTSKESKPLMSLNLEKNRISLEYSKRNQVLDYYTHDEDPISMKKLKKRKKPRSSRQVNASSLEDKGPILKSSLSVLTPSDPGSYVHSNLISSSRDGFISNDTNFVDDDDLQVALARSRNVKLSEERKKSRKTQETLVDKS